MVLTSRTEKRQRAIGIGKIKVAARLVWTLPKNKFIWHNSVCWQTCAVSTAGNSCVFTRAHKGVIGTYAHGHIWLDPLSSMVVGAPYYCQPLLLRICPKVFITLRVKALLGFWPLPPFFGTRVTRQKKWGTDYYWSKEIKFGIKQRNSRKKYDISICELESVLRAKKSRV